MVEKARPGWGVLIGLNLKSPSGPSQACAPLYSWRTEKDPQSDPVGTCYLSTDNFTRILEYAPCRSGRGQSGVTYYFHVRIPGAQGFLFMAAKQQNKHFQGCSGDSLVSFSAPASLPCQPISTQPAGLTVSFPHRFQQRGRAGLLSRGLQC